MIAEYTSEAPKQIRSEGKPDKTLWFVAKHITMTCTMWLTANFGFTTLNRVIAVNRTYDCAVKFSMTSKIYLNVEIEIAINDFRMNPIASWVGLCISFDQRNKL